MHEMVDPLLRHKRYSVQASWTVSIRERLLGQCEIEERARTLEVGAGTGVITQEVDSKYHTNTYALDIDYSISKFGHEHVPSARWCVGDGEKLPFPNSIFQIAYCHFTLMWVKNPLQVLKEMTRVSIHNGYILCMAEPDYGGRIDYPHSLAKLGALQTESLLEQGADPRIGSRLLKLFSEAGLHDIRVGLLGGEWDLKPDEDILHSERETLLTDLRELPSPDVEKLLELDEQAWEAGYRILFVPTFYAIGRVG